MVGLVLSAPMDPRNSNVPFSQFVPAWEEHDYRPYPPQLPRPASPQYWHNQPTVHQSMPSPPAASSDGSGTSSPQTAQNIGTTSEYEHVGTSSHHPELTNAFAPGAGSSLRQQPAAKESISFTDHLGYKWGPYDIGDKMFALQSYPLHWQGFQHLHANPDTYPTNFRGFVSRGKLPINGLTFLPEPELLRAIQQRLTGRLRDLELLPQRVFPNFDLREAQFLWPPVERRQGEGDLQMPADVLNPRIHKALKDRNRHEGKVSSLYHLAVPLPDGRVRHIAAMPTSVGNWAPTSRTMTSSNLWFFFEGREPINGRGFRKRMAFLGGMFLPRDSAKRLLDSGDLTMVFNHLA